MEDGKKEFEVKLPYKHDTLYFFDFVDNEIYITGFSSSEKDITRFLHGYYFKTKEEVEQHLKERKLLFKLQQWAKIKNGDWEPDWSDIENKYIIVYLNNRKHFTVESMWTVNRFYILPYFKTEELAQECIELFGDEIKEVLC